jgi:hypothetical protein
MADDRKKQFTAAKLNWLDCVSSDRRLKPAAFKVAYAIMQHVNSETLVAWPSDETLVDVTGISRSQVVRHRESLRACGWLMWKRTKDANRYTLILDQVPEGLEYILTKRAERKERREARRAERTLGAPGVPPATQPVVSPATQRDVSPATHEHLRSNTYVLTPNNTIPSLRSGVVSAEDADATRALKSDDDAKLRDHQPKAPYLQSAEAAKHALFELQDMPFGTEWCGGLDDWGADFKGASDRSERGVNFHWKRALRAGIPAEDVVSLAKYILGRTPQHHRPSLAGFLARIEKYFERAESELQPPSVESCRGPRPMPSHHAREVA